MGCENKMSLDTMTSNLSNDDKEYIVSTYEGIVKEYDGMVDAITGYSIGFERNRIYKIDMAIMLIATYEIKFIDSIPVQVSANEAVELAKVYASEKSASFINGIIASIIKEKNNECKDNWWKEDFNTS